MSRKHPEDFMEKTVSSHDFIIGPTDTDSISYCKSDMTPFTPDELDSLLKELNEISPDFMEWEDDGYYKSCIALRAKNYVLFDGKTKTTKGSAFKTSSKEPAMKEFMQELVDEMLNDNNINVLRDIYIRYVKEALNVADISRWASKKTITEAITKCGDPKEKVRKQEKDIWDAIKNEDDKQEGNKIYVYPVVLGEHTILGGVSEKTGKPLKDKVREVTGLKLTKHWNNDHNVLKLVERCYATLEIFKSVVDMNQFIDYTKKKNLSLLEKLKD